MGSIARKMARKTDSHRSQRTGHPPVDGIARALSEARGLLIRGQAAEAVAALETLDFTYPRRTDVLRTLAEACAAARDPLRLEQACERLHELEPDAPDPLLALAEAHATNWRLSLACRAYERFLRRWPQDERAPEIRRILREMRAAVPETLLSQFPEAQCWEMACEHEMVQMLMARGERDAARRAADRLLARSPTFVPALNNLSLVCWQGDDVAGAIEAVQRVLALEPDNLHASANQIRLLLFAGDTAGARQAAQHLKSLPSARPDAWIKKAEMLSYLGDDAGVLDVWREAEHVAPSLVLDHPFLLHYAAAASLRTGDEAAARNLWKQSLDAAPTLSLARKNLDDLDRPIGQRHAPWAFGISEWVPPALVDHVAENTPASGEDFDIVSLVRDVLGSHPGLRSLLPHLLARGDDAARALAFALADASGDAAVLRDFALSQDGPDDMRFKAATRAREMGALPPGIMRMWFGGTWKDVQLHGFCLDG